MRSVSSSSRLVNAATSWNLDWLYFLCTEMREDVGALRASAARERATGLSASSVKPECFCKACRHINAFTQTSTFCDLLLSHLLMLLSAWQRLCCLQSCGQLRD